MPRFDPLCRCGDGVLLGHIDFDKLHLAQAGLLKLGDGLLAHCWVSRTQQYNAPSLRQIPRKFQADAFVAAGHQCNLLECHVFSLPSMII